MKKILMVMGALVMLVLAGCGGGGGGGGDSPSSAKAITAFSFASPMEAGTVDEKAKTIEVKVPLGTDVTALIANFTTTGVSIKIGNDVQVSGTTSNNFTNAVIYTVTAADGTTAAYTVTVTLVSYATPIGAPIGSAVTATIDAAGGALSSADGSITMTVPAGAVSAPTVFSIQPIENKAHGGAGAGYHLGPEGLVLVKPVTITFQVPDDWSAGAILGIAYQDAQGNWQWMNDATRDADPPNTKTVSVTTDHFSRWSLVRGVQFTPLATSVQTNGTVGLRVIYCVPQSLSNGKVTLMNDCSGPAPLQLSTTWSVNAIPGGNSTVGTIGGGMHLATFNAPAQKPSPATVRASVEIPSLKSGEPKSIIFSSITITDVTEWHIQFVYDEQVDSGGLGTHSKSMTFDLRFHADVSTEAENIPFFADSSSFVTYSGQGSSSIFGCNSTMSGGGTITKRIQVSQASAPFPTCAGEWCTSSDDFFDAEGYVDAKNKKLVIYLWGMGYGLTVKYSGICADGTDGTDSVEYESGILDSIGGYQGVALPSANLGVLPAFVIPLDDNFAIQGGSPTNSRFGVTVSLKWNTTNPVSAP